MRLETDILPPRYRAPQRIARGGMGQIYRATDGTLGRAVAIKVLAERYAQDEAVRRRFTREALAAARLSGEPYIVTIFDVGEWHERPFIVMEYLSGGSLEDRVRESGAQKPAQALQWLEQAATALDAAHRNGVVHRDVKPANLLLDRNGDVHVADFGIASAAGLDSLTITGTVLGTAGYLSPEQARGERATPASDRYALAVVAFELLSGRRPFENESMTAEAAAHVNAPVPSISELCEHLPPELDPVFRKALAKNPAERFPDCAEFVACLRQSVAEAAGMTREFQPVAAAAPTVRVRRRRGPWLPLLVAFAVLAAVAGAILAVVLSRGGQSAAVKTVVRTIVKTGPGGATVTQRQVTTAPAASPPPPATTEPLIAPSAAKPSVGQARQLTDKATAYMRAANYTAALPVAQQALRGLSGSGDIYEAYANYDVGNTLLNLGRCRQATTYLRRAAQLEPDRTEPKRDLARARACS